MIRRRIQSVSDGPHTDKPPQAGKDARGRFCVGNHFGRGNSYVQELFRIQAAIRAQLDDDALREFVKDWISHARRGKGVYLVSLLERLAGRTADFSTEERIQELEAEIEQLIAPDAQIMDGTKPPPAAS